MKKKDDSVIFNQKRKYSTGSRLWSTSVAYVNAESRVRSTALSGLTHVRISGRALYVFFFVFLFIPLREHYTVFDIFPFTFYSHTGYVFLHVPFGKRIDETSWSLASAVQCTVLQMLNFVKRSGVPYQRTYYVLNDVGKRWIGLTIHRIKTTKLVLIFD